MQGFYLNLLNYLEKIKIIIYLKYNSYPLKFSDVYVFNRINVFTLNKLYKLLVNVKKYII
jgi:hypothetical protein